MFSLTLKDDQEPAGRFPVNSPYEGREACLYNGESKGCMESGGKQSTHLTPPSAVGNDAGHIVPPHSHTLGHSAEFTGAT